MRRFGRTLLIVVAVLLPNASGCHSSPPSKPKAATPQPKPNIVILLADDLGWGDVGYHKGEIKTPNVDRLANAGVKLEQFYVSPVCTPTRAALMTGRYPMRYGWQVGVVRPWTPGGLPLEERTLAQALKEAGYATSIVGKWHLGHSRPEYLPMSRGFDHHYGHYNGEIDYNTHMQSKFGGFDWHRDNQENRDEGYSTKLIAREAVRVIEEQKDGTPLLLYVAFNAVHEPHQAPDEYTEQYPSLTGTRRIYAGMTAALDEAAGQIVEAVDKRGWRQNTIFVFSSDNGGAMPGTVSSNGPFRGGKTTTYEGGVRAAAFVAWEGHIKANTTCNEPLHIVDLYPTLLKLAGASPSQKLPLDGLDAWPTLSECKPTPHAEILHNTAPFGGALRVGDWKLVINGDDGSISPLVKVETDKVELFNIVVDPYETKNLADQEPTKLKELRARYDALAKQAAKPETRESLSRPAGFTVPRVWGQAD